jgi:hypothetical protein
MLTGGFTLVTAILNHRSGFRSACRRRPGRLRPWGRELSWTGGAAPRSLRPVRHARDTCSNPRRRDVALGSAKRVASAVGEGSVAVQLLHSLFAADQLHPRGRPKEPAVVHTGQTR